MILGFYGCVSQPDALIEEQVPAVLKSHRRWRAALTVSNEPLEIRRFDLQKVDRKRRDRRVDDTAYELAKLVRRAAR